MTTTVTRKGLETHPEGARAATLLHDGPARRAEMHARNIAKLREAMGKAQRARQDIDHQLQAVRDRRAVAQDTLAKAEADIERCRERIGRKAAPVEAACEALAAAEKRPPEVSGLIDRLERIDGVLPADDAAELADMVMHGLLGPVNRILEAADKLERVQLAERSTQQTARAAMATHAATAARARAELEEAEAALAKARDSFGGKIDELDTEIKQLGSDIDAEEVARREAIAERGERQGRVRVNR